MMNNDWENEDKKILEYLGEISKLNEKYGLYISGTKMIVLEGDVIYATKNNRMVGEDDHEVFICHVQ